MTHTPESLLAAVGVDWTQRYAFIVCPECQMIMAYKGIPQHGLDCRRPSTRDVEPTYTGPALNTPELDAVLLVEGVKWLYNRVVQTSQQDVDNLMFEAFGNNIGWESSVLFHALPGHALAAAIAEGSSC